MNVQGTPASPVLVTGAAGFIGTALCRVLVDLGCEVRGLDLERSDTSQLDELGVSYFPADITEPESLGPALDGVRTVFHLAALASDWGPRELFMAINASGTANVLEAAHKAGVERLVHMSSLAVHSFSGHVDSGEETPLENHVNGYCSSKIEAEHLVREYQAADRLQTTIIRPGAIIHGPGDTTAFVHLAPYLEKGRMMLIDGGRHLTCYSHSENLVRGMALAAAREEGAGQTFILTDDIKLTIHDYMSAICRALDVPPRFRSIPRWLARPGGWVLEALYKLAGASRPPIAHRYRVGLVADDIHFSCAKAKRLLGYRPEVSFSDSLRLTAEWYRRLRH